MSRLSARGECQCTARPPQTITCCQRRGIFSVRASSRGIHRPTRKSGGLSVRDRHRGSPVKGVLSGRSLTQDYAAYHPTNSYIVYNDAPKVSNLRLEFPELYRAHWHSAG